MKRIKERIRKRRTPQETNKKKTITKPRKPNERIRKPMRIPRKLNEIIRKPIKENKGNQKKQNKKANQKTKESEKTK